MVGLLNESHYGSESGGPTRWEERHLRETECFGNGPLQLQGKGGVALQYRRTRAMDPELFDSVYGRGSDSGIRRQR